MSRYFINILASRDINEIADYFAETKVETGERFSVNSTASANNLLPFQTVVKVTQKFVQTSEVYPCKVISFSTEY